MRGLPDRYPPPAVRSIYTFYQAQVLDTLERHRPVRRSVAMPGGTANGYRQSFPGTPQLTEGKEYILFLWTSKSGLTQIIGLTQGSVRADHGRERCGYGHARRHQQLHARSAHRTVVKDQSIQMQIRDLRRPHCDHFGERRHELI